LTVDIIVNTVIIKGVDKPPTFLFRSNQSSDKTIFKRLFFLNYVSGEQRLTVKYAEGLFVLSTPFI